MNAKVFIGLCLAAAAAIGLGVVILDRNTATQRTPAQVDSQELPLVPDVVTQPRADDINQATLFATQIPDINGKATTLAKWQGNWLVINFWATWCAPCREEMPMFSQVHEQFSSKKVQFIGISADSIEKVVDFQRKTPVSYPLFPADAQAMEFSKRLGNRIGVLPHTVILNPAGEVVLNKVGLVQKEDLLKIFGENH